MKRYYYVTDDLDELEAVEKELEQNGFATPQIHVLSSNDAAVSGRAINNVNPFMKTNVVRSAMLGAAIGAIVSTLAITIAYSVGMYSLAGWAPIAFLALVLLGFFTWEGGLYGIQEPNTRFTRFKDVLSKGKHVLFVDTTPQQEMMLQAAINEHPALQEVGDGEGSPAWLVSLHDRWSRFIV
jgi:hypothetical protein